MRNIDPIELHLFLKGIYMKYGFDFREYAEASLYRRIDYVLNKFNAKDPLELLGFVLKDKKMFYSMLSSLTTTTTEFFRDPQFFNSLRKTVIPILHTYPTINIWVAGCSTGEEAYSLSILLKEENLKSKATIYATDINPQALKTAKEGIYSLESAKVFTKNYIESGGINNPSNYYTADYGLARFNPSLRENIVFSEHNLVTDDVFAETHLILCRNVLIYFNRDLQNHTLNLFNRSLVYKGILALGTKETLRFSDLHNNYEPLDNNLKIFQKNSYTVADISNNYLSNGDSL